MENSSPPAIVSSEVVVDRTEQRSLEWCLDVCKNALFCFCPDFTFMLTFSSLG